LGILFLVAARTPPEWGPPLTKPGNLDGFPNNTESVAAQKVRIVTECGEFPDTEPLKN
jgi:hypothetical protein